MRYLNMAALVLLGIMAIACSSDDENSTQTPPAETPQAETAKTVTLTTTLSFGGESNVKTRALTDQGVKIFAERDQIAVVYTNTSSERVVAVSSELTAGDITNEGKSADFTVTLTNPVAGSVDYIYPASMANDDGTLNYSALNVQDGTLSSLSSNLDCAKGTGTMTESGGVFTLPNVLMANQFAICAFTIKNGGGSEITSDITGLTVSDGANTYTVNRAAAAGPIYVAMQPVSDKPLSFVANDASNRYHKSVSGKSLEAGDMVPINLTMPLGGNIIDLSKLEADCVAQNGDILINKLAASHKISIAAGAIVILKNVDINYGTTLAANYYAGINCLGNATLIVVNATEEIEYNKNYVKGFSSGYPGIFVPSGSTLTITGSGTLYALGHDNGAGIGSARSNIAAVKDAGNIVIQGGTIFSTGGYGAAGIGSGAGVDENLSSCGSITIKSSVTEVNAIVGYGSSAECIGRGDHSTCGTITIEDPSKVHYYYNN